MPVLDAARGGGGWRERGRRIRPGRRTSPDRCCQEGRRGDLVHDPDHRPTRASRERRLREEVRHQGALDARQLDRTFGQDHQRKPGGQAAIRRVRRNLDGRAAQERRLRAAMAAGSGQVLSGAVQGPGGLLGREQPVLPDAGLQYRPRSQRNGAAQLPGAARSEMARQDRLEHVAHELGRPGLHRHRADRDGDGERNALSARALQAEDRQYRQRRARGARPGHRRRISAGATNLQSSYRDQRARRAPRSTGSRWSR